MHTLWVDASDKGFGGVWQNKTVQGLWSHDEATQSINWQELQAIKLTLQTLKHLRQTTVLIRTDNMTASAYVNKQGGTSLRALCLLARELWEICIRRGLTIQAKHIRSIDDVWTD